MTSMQQFLAEHPNFDLIDCLHQSGPAAVYRAKDLTSQEVVILKLLEKAHANDSYLKQIHNEYELLTQFSDVHGLPDVRDFIETHSFLTLVFSGFEGESLSQILESQELSPVQVVHILKQGVRVLSNIHNHNIIHKDIKPDNIIWNRSSEEIQIIDFGLAVQFSHGQDSFFHYGGIGGSLYYMPPEQTGRVNRSIDYRSDYYALGMTAYELLCKRKPYPLKQSQDDIIYAILAIEPTAPNQIDPRIPQALSDIVMRLIAKDAEDRYQTSQGLLHDLALCLKEDSLELGQWDILSEFNSPKKLYGREKELERLRLSLANIIEKGSESVFISGFSGIGKTAIVRELHLDIQQANGYFIEGKYDQLQQDQPGFALIQAFDAFFASLLVESDESIARWTQLLRTHLGENIKVLVQLLPNLSHLVGDIEEPIYLAGEEGLNRLIFSFLALIKLISSPEKPLVIFIDDLQWMDLASEILLSALFSSNDIQHVLFIGAYRENEIAKHATAKKLLNPEQQNIWPRYRLELSNLTQDNLQQIIEDGFQHRIQEPHLLASYLQQKTAGNPFFTIQLIKRLIEKGVIAQGIDHIWRYKTQNLEQLAITDNLVSLMIEKIKDLPNKQRDILQTASAIGHEFSIDTLSLITQRTTSELKKELTPAIQQGLVLATDSMFTFAHDGIQKAAYEISDRARTEAQHFKIGFHLLAHSESLPDIPRQLLFSICFHLNKCVDLIQTEQDKIKVIELNLKAASTSRRSAAYQTSFYYAQTALDLAQKWASKSLISNGFNIYKEAAESAYLAGEQKEAEIFFEQAEAAACSNSQHFQIASIRVAQLVSVGKYTEALACGITVLREIEVDLPDPYDVEAVEESYREKEQLFKTTWLDKGKAIADLYDLPINQELEIRQLMELLGAIYPAVLMTATHYLKIITIELVNLSIKHGNTAISPICYAWHGGSISVISNSFDQAYEFGQLAMRLNENKIKNTAISCKIYNMVGNFTSFFKEPLRDTLATLEHAYSMGMASGDKLYSSYSLINELRNRLSTGIRLDKWLAYDEKVKAKLAEFDAHLMIEVRESFHAYALQLTGQSYSLENLDNKQFSEQEYRKKFADVPLFGCLIDLFKMQACYLLGQFDVALPLAESDVTPIDSFPQGVDSRFFSALVLMREIRYQPNHSKREIWQTKIRSHIDRLTALSLGCPQNFLHLHKILLGYQAVLDQEPLKALQHYNQAIQNAKVNLFIQYQALANELAAELCFAEDMTESAEIHIQEAYKLYGEWGASEKVNQLLASYSNISFNKPLSTHTSLTSTSIDQQNIYQKIDLKSIMEASLALSSEIEVDLLVERLMKVAVQGSGAQRALLLIQAEGQWRLSAEYSGSGDYQYYTEEKQQEPDDALPRSVLHFVAHSHETLHLTDALTTAPYSRDHYVQQHQARSIICLPLRHQNTTKAILYIENNLAKNSFTEEQFQRLTLLSAQMASAIDHSLNYQRLSDSEQHYRTLLKNLPIATLVHKRSGHISYANKNALHLLEFKALTQDQEDINQLDGELINESMEPLSPSPIDQIFANETPITNLLTGFRGRHSNQVRWFILNAFPQYTHNRLSSVLTCLVDVSERREHVEKIRSLAYFDSLTGLANRVSLEQKLEESIQLSIAKNQYCAALLLDLDNFKMINDSLGHWVGDEVLKQVARNLHEATEGEHFIARIGGDEFILVTSMMADDEAKARQKVIDVANKIQTSFSKKFHINGRLLNSSASIGAAIIPSDAMTVTEVLKRADSALYNSKRSGKNTLSFFDIEQEIAMQRSFELQDAIPEAIENNQFKLVYQPKVHIKTGQISGVEALIRWHHPVHGLIPPSEFIPITEESGSIIRLGAYILKAACCQAKHWCELKGGDSALCKVSVNVSSVQFIDQGFEQVVEEALTESGLPAHMLDIEITESFLIDNIETTIEKMHALKDLGISFSIDDFGTGYSSLEYLKRLPIDTIKIDQSFIRDMIDDQGDRAIVETIISMAKNLKLSTVAEGVEEAEHLSLLEALDCDQYQGYYFSKPLAPEDFEALLKKGH